MNRKWLRHVCGSVNGRPTETDPRAPDTPELCSENRWSLRPKATSTVRRQALVPRAPTLRAAAPPPLSPGQEGGQVVGRGGVRAQGRGRHERGCLGPVLAPVVGAVGAQTGSDGLAENEGALGGKHSTCVTSEWSLVGRAGPQTPGTSENEAGQRQSVRRPSFSQASPRRPQRPRPPAPQHPGPTRCW